MSGQPTPPLRSCAPTHIERSAVGPGRGGAGGRVAMPQRADDGDVALIDLRGGSPRLTQARSVQSLAGLAKSQSLSTQGAEDAAPSAPGVVHAASGEHGDLA